MRLYVDVTAHHIIFLGTLTLVNGTDKLSRNVNKKPTYAAQQPRQGTASFWINKYILWFKHVVLSTFHNTNT